MDTPLPSVLETKLADFRRRVWIVKLAEGLLAAAFGLALSYVVVFVLDRLMETPQWLRVTVLLLGAAGAGVGLPLKWHRWVWRQRRLEDAARLLRRKMPRLGDQLLGIVELARMQDANTGRSERLVRAAMAQAADAVKDQDFRKAVPHARHVQWAWAAGGALALVVASFVLASDAARNALVRWLTPWSKVERFTFARVDGVPNKLVVPYAEPFDLPVKLAPSTRWSPGEALARIGNDDAVGAKLQGDTYPLAFPARKADADLFLAVGDVRKQVRIEPRNRPELTAFAVRLHMPAYLQYKTEPVVDIRSGTIQVLKGAQAAFGATASLPLASAELDGQPQTVGGDKFSTSYLAIQKSVEYHFAWKDRDGLAPREPLVLKVTAVEDEAPRIMAKRDSLEQVVLDSEVLSFDLTASDDFGIRRVGLEWKGIPSEGPAVATPAHGDKLAAAGEPEKKDLNAKATFCAEREGVAPQSLEIRGWADDYLPGRKRSYSASFVVHVLNKTDHALWLTEQFGKWLQLARESYEREQQLHQTNKELRAMSPADLDRPENRRRVNQQASAETANADRLSNLNQVGRQLVEQATRNPEFDAKRLESWATMLQSLHDIAAQRMPSVTDLLKQTASATTGAGKPGSPQEAKPGSPQEGKSGSPAAPSGASPTPSPSQKSQQASAPPQGPSTPKGPELAHGPQSPPPSATPTPSLPGEPKPPVPSITDRESSMSKPAPAEQKAEGNAAPKPPSAGKLTLPTTQMAAAPTGKKADPDPGPPQSPAQEKMEKAVKEQRDLLAEFAKVADQLNDILGSLEASTFVKRLKLASRQQMTVASDLNKGTLDAFGLEKKNAPEQPAKTGDAIAGREKDQSESVRVIQSDLEAYFQRKQDMRFKNILDQMKKTEVVRELAKLGERVSQNLSGQSIAASEFWADTMDRWAEEMVAASDCKSNGKGSADSLPPEIVLMVMQALHDEMKLRDETREAENSKAAQAAMDYKKRVELLARSQEKNAMKTMDAVDSILMLPQGGQKFNKELKLLSEVKHVMDEAGGILDKPDTGPEAIAAETEAIELLLQAKRPNPKGGGGGGGSSPGSGNGMFSATQAALSELGPGSDAETSVAARPVRQATGRAGREFPDEFKAGLDAYFNKLEGQGVER